MPVVPIKKKELRLFQRRKPDGISIIFILICLEFPAEIKNFGKGLVFLSIRD